MAALLGCVTFFSFIYSMRAGGNQNSRFDLLRAIVERHTLQIDAYHENTQDKAHFQGHYYSDKAPGLVFLAVPFAWRADGDAGGGSRSGVAARGICAVVLVTACSVALPTALAAVCLFFLALRFGWGRWRRRCGAGDVRGNSDLGVCEFVLGACAGGSLPGVCVACGVEDAATLAS